MDRSQGILKVAAVAALLHCPAVALASQENPVAGEAGACPGAVGAYLLERQVVIRKQNWVGRMLLTLTVGGNAIFTDSAQSGIYGYQPFTDAQGVWECLGEKDGSGKVRVMLLDFTSSTAREPEAKIARLDFEAHYDIENGEIEGDAVLRFAPLTVDPYEVDKFNAPRDYPFSGSRLGFSR
ncbi:hypothetical protein K1W69_09200 [Hoeflea sp. WL0058]|uniref:Uncharacterized protein n=1 Tax=Flavimaribacter sediminis TaxID=2865987 RepID=A0AAE2ZML0_9HYPH|nr:hypothetical protein [Flavimaribacter sediminis]MBW8637362.1 hypothetical protein [Flavimaribacter sediminis]